MGSGISVSVRAQSTHGPIRPSELEALTREVVSNGTVPLKDQRITRSAVVRLMRGPQQIFSVVKDMARNAKDAFDAISYEWDESSDVAKLMVAGIVENLAARLSVLRTPKHKRGTQPRVQPLTVRLITDYSFAYDYMNHAAADRQYKSAQITKMAKGLMETAKNMGAGDLLQLEARVWRHETFSSNHSKYFLQDSKYVVITGNNIDNFYNWTARDGAAPKGTAWHDTGMQLLGPIAGVLTDAFNNAWSQSTAYAATAVPPPARKPRYFTLGSRRHASRVMLVSKDWNRLNVSDVENPQDVAWLYIMAHAQTHIHIESPNINDAEFQVAVLQALQRGVRVRIITGFKAGDDAQKKYVVGGGTNLQIVERMHKFMLDHAPAQAALLETRWYSADGQAPVEGYSPGQSHTKYMAVDDRVLMMGSGNQDTQSWKHSRETNVVVFDHNVVKRAERLFFLRDWKHSVPTVVELPAVVVPKWLIKTARSH